MSRWKPLKQPVFGFQARSAPGESALRESQPPPPPPSPRRVPQAPSLRGHGARLGRASRAGASLQGAPDSRVARGACRGAYLAASWADSASACRRIVAKPRVLAVLRAGSRSARARRPSPASRSPSDERNCRPNNRRAWKGWPRRQDGQGATAELGQSASQTTRTAGARRDRAGEGGQACSRPSTRASRHPMKHVRSERARRDHQDRHGRRRAADLRARMALVERRAADR